MKESSVPASLERVQQPENTKSVFDRVLRGKLHLVPPDNFESRLEGVTSITFVPIRGEKPSLNITANYQNESGKERRATFSMFGDGVFAGRPLVDLQHNKEDIEREALRILETIHLDFWHTTELPLKLESDEADGPVQPRGEGEPRGDLIQPERLAFMEKQPAVFGFRSKKGFNNFWGAAFQREGDDPEGFWVIDRDEWGNAAYLIEAHGPLVRDPELMRKLRQRELSEDEKDRILQQGLGEILSKAKTRKTLREVYGAKQLIHSGDWERRFRDTILERLNAMPQEEAV